MFLPAIAEGEAQNISEKARNGEGTLRVKVLESNLRARERLRMDPKTKVPARILW